MVGKARNRIAAVSPWNWLNLAEGDRRVASIPFVTLH
jgi:hypothetical protein